MSLLIVFPGIKKNPDNQMNASGWKFVAMVTEKVIKASGNAE